MLVEFSFSDARVGHVQSESMQVLAWDSLENLKPGGKQSCAFGHRSGKIYCWLSSPSWIKACLQKERI